MLVNIQLIDGMHIRSMLSKAVQVVATAVQNIYYCLSVSLPISSCIPYPLSDTLKIMMTLFLPFQLFP
jgi:hypothetical protein